MKLMQFSLAPLAIAGVCMFATEAPAQEASPKSTPTESQVTAQTGDGLLTLQAQMPQQVRAGEEFSYTVKATNSSDNMTLHDIVLKQRKSEGFTVESVTKQKSNPDTASAGNEQSTQADKQGANDQASDQTGDQDESAPKEDAEKNEQPEPADEQSENQSKSSNKQIEIDTLEPGESQTFVVKATADQEGDLKSCLEISNYTSAICLTTKVIKPELQLTKTAPENADRCDVIELVYTLQNGGTGDVGAVEITDDLGEGLVLIDGDKSLKFDIDGLSAGDTRKFVAQVYATQPGSFSSRATAKATQSDLQSRSEKTTTQVSAADLAVKVTGPKQVYGDKAAKFTAMVTNTGNVDAADVDVTVRWPEQAKIADLSEVSMTKMAEQSAQNEAGDQQPTPAENSEQSDATNENQPSSGSDQANTEDPEDENAKMTEKSFKIESLAAGQTAQFEYSIGGSDLTTIPTQVEATYVCAVDAATDQEQAQSDITAAAMARVKVVRLPALQIMIIDDSDPVSTGDEVTYNTRVWNEGDADDNDVQLILMIPDGLEFTSAEGPTEFEQDGSTVTFEPLKVMEAGQREDFKLVAKANGTGSVKMKAELSSKTLDSPVVSEEPTELFDEEAEE